jgi:outer membrane protein assembly factor BamB
MFNWRPSGRFSGPISCAVIIAVTGSALLLPASGDAAVVDASPWPSALHDSTHTATANVRGPVTAHLAWSRRLSGGITPGPVVGSDGTIYVATNAGVLYAINPTSGANRWTFEGGGPFTGETDLSVSPLLLSSGSILWPGPKDTLYELSSSGAEEWSHVFDGMILSPVASGQDVYIMTMAGTLTKVQVGGTVPVVAWSVTVGHTSFGSPVVSPDGNVITTVDRSVVAVTDHGNAGSVRWRVSATASIEVSPSVSMGGEVFVTANDASVYAIDPDGTVHWRRVIGHESYSSSTVTSKGVLVFGDNSGALNFVRASNGSLVRRDQGVKGLWGGQAIDDRGDVYFGTQGKGIYGFNRQGRQLFHLTASSAIDSYPALTANGTLIVGDESGTLYAVG